jgi:hypothetical protein
MAIVGTVALVALFVGIVIAVVTGMPDVVSDVYSSMRENALTWCAVRVSNPGPAD